VSERRKLLAGHTFIRALEDAGLLPDRTVSVFIRATVGEPVELSYETLADELLLDIAGAIRETDDTQEALAR
jgi:hypothetical protein